jgi:hypothetical protein
LQKLLPKAGSLMRLRQMGHGAVTQRVVIFLRPKVLALMKEISCRLQLKWVE